MKTAWTILLISALTDFVITAGASFTTAIMATGVAEVPNQAVLLTVLVGGLVVAARTIQQALKASMDTSATKQLTTSVPPKT